MSDSYHDYGVELAPGGSHVTSFRPSSPLAWTLPPDLLLLLPPHLHVSITQNISFTPFPAVLLFSSGTSVTFGFHLCTLVFQTGIHKPDCTPRLLTQVVNSFPPLSPSMTPPPLCIPGPLAAASSPSPWELHHCATLNQPYCSL